MAAHFGLADLTREKIIERIYSHILEMKELGVEFIDGDGELNPINRRAEREKSKARRQRLDE